MNWSNTVHRLDAETVKSVVPKWTTGNYLLGSMDTGMIPFPFPLFKVSYFGRSDSDLQKRLLDHVNEGKAPSFKFGIAESVAEAFHTECFHFHEYETILLDQIHPDKPDGMDIECERCSILGAFRFLLNATTRRQ